MVSVPKQFPGHFKSLELLGTPEKDNQQRSLIIHTICLHPFESCAAAVKAMGGKNNGSAIARAIKRHYKSYGYYWERSTTISEESTPKLVEVGDIRKDEDIV